MKIDKFISIMIIGEPRRMHQKIILQNLKCVLSNQIPKFSNIKKKLMIFP